MNAHSFVRRTSLTILMVVAVANSATGEVLFKEPFDDQPDWTSGMDINATDANPAGKPDRVQSASTHVIPEGWYSIRQDPVWAPSTGYPDRHETIEILSSNA